MTITTTIRRSNILWILYWVQCAKCWIKPALFG